MKKITLVCCLIGLTVLTAFAQWQWQNPKHQGHTLNDVQFIDPLTGWAVGEFGTIIGTEDGGFSWEILNSGTSQHLTKLSVAGTTDLWAVGDSGAILHSSNGGVDWVQQSSGTDLSLSDVCFVSPNQGWALGGFFSSLNEYETVILSTIDGGDTWNTQLHDTTFAMGALHFLDEYNGWAVGFSWEGYSCMAVVMRTSDGGYSWDEQYTLPDSWPGTYDIFFISPLKGWFIASEMILHTEDGGNSWNIQYEGSTWDEYLKKVCFVNEFKGWAVGSYGNGPHYPVILSTINGGLCWEEQSNTYEINEMCEYFASGVSFSDPSNGWIVGTGGHILNTSDGGSAWYLLSGVITTADVLDIHFTDQDHGWAVGLGYCGFSQRSCAMNTSDGGMTWNEYDFNNSSFYPSSVFFTNNLSGYMAGRSGYPLYQGEIRHTADGGLTWQTQYNLLMSGYVWLNDLFFIDELNGWVVGQTGGSVSSNILIRTNNGGFSWIKYNKATTGTGLNAVYFTGLSDGWAAGIGGVVLKTADAGVNWENVDIGTTCDLNDVRFIDSNKGWIIGGKESSQYGWEAIILHTDDGGATWNTQLYDTNFMLFKGSFPDQENGWVVGKNKNYEGIVLQTQDGGATWHEQTICINHPFYSVFFIDTQEGWIGGSWGSILHTTNGGVSGHKPILGRVKDKESMMQISPNPTRGIFNLQFTIYNLQSVSCSIYDLHGQEVAVVLDGVCSGDQVVRWDASGLPAGIYFVELRAKGEGHRMVGKLVVAR
jgi:photosystem II stability/assembly factor-like uncharacterized protein